MTAESQWQAVVVVVVGVVVVVVVVAAAAAAIVDGTHGVCRPGSTAQSLGSHHPREGVPWVGVHREGCTQVLLLWQCKRNHARLLCTAITTGRGAVRKEVEALHLVFVLRMTPVASRGLRRHLCTPSPVISHHARDSRSRHNTGGAHCLVRPKRAVRGGVRLCLVAT